MILNHPVKQNGEKVAQETLSGFSYLCHVPVTASAHGHDKHLPCMCDHHPPSAGTAHYTRGIVCKGMHMHTSTYICTKECMSTSVGMLSFGSWHCQVCWPPSEGVSGLDCVTLGSRARLPWQFFYLFICIVAGWFLTCRLYQKVTVWLSVVYFKVCTSMLLMCTSFFKIVEVADGHVSHVTFIWLNCIVLQVMLSQCNC